MKVRLKPWKSVKKCRFSNSVLHEKTQKKTKYGGAVFVLIFALLLCAYKMTADNEQDEFSGAVSKIHASFSEMKENGAALAFFFGNDYEQDGKIFS
ncbi:MAG: hypothetical protein J5922_04640 [Clostridia bacterium]|nr:hypothetical protein [Clostridia bacterium]